MAIALVQTKTGNGGGYANTNVQALATAVTAGNMLVLGVTMGSADTIASVTDNRGNAWTLVTSSSNGERAVWLYYVKSAKAGATTVTVTFGSGMYPDSALVVREYSGLGASASIDKFATGSDGTNYVQVHPAGTTAATSAANELVVVVAGASDKTPGWSLGSTYGNLALQAGFDLYSSVAMQDKVVSATGTQTGSMNTTSYVRGIGVIATFQADVVSTGKIKAYVGGQFVAKPVKAWNGSSWVVKPVKRWSGTAWVPTNY
jgi:hypothetical protein